ncbi:hypothetical protein EYM_05040 [Ignicoccus islandicus DSM 13165]|uniref:Uncharacterized protein n=1 Tax=Ignicoccus islandicus DSM 13165 TaxID=940295 RepID=A0A0U2VEX3_9CREN|nr:hypothetical protein [Ignicoccus islandicus]ALU12546.1 hypothetical protein EYM_05040 [Ignicoccus islandicus DSM 13165]
MAATPTYQGRSVPEEGQLQGEQRYGITKVTRIRLFGRWFPSGFWRDVMAAISEITDNQLVSVRSFRTPRGVILTDIDIAGELSADKIRKLEDGVIKAMESNDVNVRRFLKIEIRERPASLFVSQD